MHQTPESKEIKGTKYKPNNFGPKKLLFSNSINKLNPRENSRRRLYEKMKKIIGRTYFKNFLEYVNFYEDKTYISKISRISSMMASGYQGRLNKDEQDLFIMANILKTIKLVEPKLTRLEGVENLNKIMNKLRELSGNDFGEKIRDAQTILAISFVLKMDMVLSKHYFNESFKSQEKEKWVKAAKRYVVLLHELGLRKSAQFVSYSLVKYLEGGKKIADEWNELYPSKLKPLKKHLKSEIKKLFFLLPEEQRPEIFGRIKDPYSIYTKIKEGEEVDDLIGLSIVLKRESEIMKVIEALFNLFSLNNYQVLQLNDYFNFGYKRQKSKENWDEESLTLVWKNMFERFYSLNLKQYFYSNGKEKFVYLKHNGDTRFILKFKKRSSGYRAIHIKLNVNEVPVEIQITSKKHYDIKEYGRASHDSYAVEEGKIEKIDSFNKALNIIRRAFKFSISLDYANVSFYLVEGDKNSHPSLSINKEVLLGDLNQVELNYILNLSNTKKRIVLNIKESFIKEINNFLLKNKVEEKQLKVVLYVDTIKRLRNKVIYNVYDVEV